MKKLLTIVGFFFMVGNVFAGEAKVTASINSGSGWIAATTSSTAPAASSSDWSNTEPKSANKGGLFNGGEVYAHAKADSEYTFAYWIIDGNTSSTSLDNPYKVSSIFISSSEKSVAAVFKKIITPSADNSTIQLKPGQSAGREITFYNPSNVTVSIQKDAVTSTEISCTTSTSIKASGETKVQYTITATESVQKGDEFTITFAATNNAEYVLTVKIVDDIKITFIAPNNGGMYQAINQSGSGDNVTMEIGSDQVEKILTDEVVYELRAKPTTEGYRFSRWVITNGENELHKPCEAKTYDGQTYYCCEYSTTDGDQITAEFIEDTYAMFMVQGTPGVYYSDLTDGLSAAAESSKVLLVYQSGELKAGHYQIPAGLTLLVPGDDNNTLRVGDALLSDFSAPNPAPTRVCKKELTLQSGTTIEVYGSLSIYAALSMAMGSNGTPWTYGRIRMGENCHITLQDKAVLTAFGYITGNPDNSSVTAKSGATVYETFQIMDWRGGSVVTKLAGIDMEEIAKQAMGSIFGGGQLQVEAPGNSNKVFPVGQYYIQNIETKLVIEAGAVEKLATAVDMSLAQVEANVFFVVPDNSNYSAGLFKLNNCKLIKHYDVEKDRLCIKLEGESVNSSNVNIDKMRLVFKTELYSIPVEIIISSEIFNLPITNNMDVEISNVQLTTTSPLAFLAGSTLNVKETSKICLDADLYVYDKEQNTGYFYDTKTGSDQEIIPIVFTPDGSQKQNGVNKRPSLYPLEDCKWIIDGELEMRNGALYTTYYQSGGNGKSTNVLDYGANITSTGNGKVIFTKKGTATTTHQYSQIKTVDYVSIPITNAQLSNDVSKPINKNMPYSAGNDVTASDEYTYVKSQGRWLLPQNLAFMDYDDEVEYVLTSPTDLTQTITFVVQASSTVTKDNFTVSLQGDTESRFEILETNYVQTSKGDDQLLVSLKYKHQNIHNLNTPYNVAKLRVIAKELTSDEPVGEAEVSLIATEDYTPQFMVTIENNSIENNGVYFMNGYAGRDTKAKVVITATPNTVAILETITWSSSIEDPFTFTYGEDNTKLSDATLIYHPLTSGDVSKQLILTASYNDEEKTVSNQFTINLNATAQQRPNKLTFAPELLVEGGAAIYQGESIASIFKDINQGNGKDVSFTYTDPNGLVSIDKLGNGNYQLKANLMASVKEPQTITITATQPEIAGEANGWNGEFNITILPPAVWNWSTLYFGGNYDNPITTQGGEEWTLTKTKDDCGIVTLLGNFTDGYTIEVGTPADPATTCEATFEFATTDGTYTETFTSILYADPRLLPYCVDSERIYNGVKVSDEGVTFDNTYNTLTFATLANWECTMQGVPDKLTFTPTGSNAWQITEKDIDGNVEITMPWTSLTEETSVMYSLKPTTRSVIISYGAQTETVGTISNLCISKLSLKADMQKVYLPVPGTKNLTFTHSTENILLTASTTDLSVSSRKTEMIDGYYKTTITLTASVSGNFSLTAQEGTEQLIVDVVAYDFPQGLPIRMAEDDSERYYFVTTDSTKYTQWNEETKRLTLTNPGAQYITRYVMFAFEGAPSVIKFDIFDNQGTPIDVVDDRWKIKESADGTFFSDASSEKRDSVGGNTLTQGLGYHTRYVLIEYNAAASTEVVIGNLVIEGYPQVVVNPLNMKFQSDLLTQQLTTTAINLDNIRFELDNKNAFALTLDVTDYIVNEDEKSSIVITENSHNGAFAHALGTNKVGDVVLGVKWLQANALDEGTIKIFNGDNDNLMATITLLGADNYLEKGASTGIYTGIPDGTRDINDDGQIDNDDKYTYHGNDYTNYPYHQVDLINTFAEDGTVLFDYLIIYGETTPAEGTDITAPQRGSADGSTNIGSNAVTPYYIYRKALNTSDEYKGYELVAKVDNVNTGNKAIVNGVIVADTAAVVHIDATNSLRVYMTGFAPYATTGYTKNQEGVFLFRGHHGSKLDIYLEDFHVYSRNKTQHGNGFYGDKEGGEIFTDGYARGSGGVLVFENVDPQEQLQNYQPFEVTIHTVGNNLLSSNYGCFFGLAMNQTVAMKAYQVSSPISIHMFEKGHARKTKTTLNFTDEWPTAVDENNVVTASKRTNGFLALKKQANNAPSIDMGNKHTEVNFKGGRVELQNSQIGSDTYKTTLAISHRSGFFGSDDLGIQLCYGIGTDSVGGVVNFLDGTVTVERMKVADAYRQYYLMDTIDGQESEYTTCLRTPKKTYIRGGSVCRVRACQHVTSKGGAPKDSERGELLGQYVYTLKPDKDVVDVNTQLATINGFPKNVEGLEIYYSTNGYTYSMNSVSPDAKNQFYFWIPNGYGGVEAEVDKFMSKWKACMMQISAGIPGVQGSVGGDTEIDSEEEVENLMYCQIDKNIYDVINAGPVVGGKKDYTYEPPFEVPSAAQSFFGGQNYTRYDILTGVGSSLQHQVLSEPAYTITGKVYYVTTATADIWQTFTAPFDVAKIWIVETYDETRLETMGSRSDILRIQAQHNADFAAFFAVAMAMGTDKDFDGIYESYKKWAYTEDVASGLYEGDYANYNLRNMQELTPYYGTNWRDANFYLNHNSDSWFLKNDDTYETKWKLLPDTATADGILLHQGETYSIMFPYCTGCGTSLEARTDWDYWSGKFLIFESSNDEQTIQGRDFLNDTIAGHIFTQTPQSDELIVTGNSTFAQLNTERANVYAYNSYAPFINQEIFEPLEYLEDQTIYPTTSFLYGELPTNGQSMPARGIKRTGEIIYDDDNNGNQNGTSGHIPTVGGGNDLFITSIEGGINVAVAAPQYVRVLSSTGSVIYSVLIQTALDIPLPCVGVYVVSGEKEVQKVMY